MSTELDLIHDGNGRTVATRGATRSEIALGPDQTSWTPKQVAALRQLGIEDAPEGDLEVFFHVCRTTGLDPFRKQIYMIGRKTKVKVYNERLDREVEDWTTKYTIQTGIDGFRRNGQKAAKREGTAIRTDGPYWQGEDGNGWQDVWLGARPPAAAKFVIFRDGEAHTGIAMYREFVQLRPGTTNPNSMWAKMPANQLAKCAEAQAWRRAYPDDFSGMQLEDAAQVIDSDGTPVPVTAQRAASGDGRSTGGGTITSGLIRSWPAEEPPANEGQGASNSSAKPTNLQADEGSTPVVSEPAAKNPESDSAKLKRRSKKADIDEAVSLMDALQTRGVQEFADQESRLVFVRTLFDDQGIAGPDSLTPEQRSYLLIELRGLLASSEGRDTVAEATDTNEGEQTALDTEGGDQ